MPCFKGLAVSIHTPDGPLPEYSIQKQSRQSRITSYIPVPQPKISADSTKVVPSSFALSITLLVPGLGVPYSRPQPTPEDPFPRHKVVGGLPGLSGERGTYGPVIGPYVPLTSSPNETIAAYIHFDGRAKEEVATLLRRGEETWVNSRWVSIPQSEGGGLAEREFLFREVGLERWLNGLDLQGETKDVEARIERRKQRLEKKRKKKLEQKNSDDEDDVISKTRRARPVEGTGILRYGGDKSAPVETISADDNFSTDSESDEDMQIPEATGQIKISLYRVLASGEIKRGEYSPQFGAHDDDGQMGEGNVDANVDHTTTFAKPKTLDPKSISTQTVTGIDPPDRPYATFTFLYRGHKQLQKMGILSTPEPQEQKASNVKRKSKQFDFGSLGPLQPKGTVGFTGYREAAARKPSKTSKRDDDEMDSDADDDTKPTKDGIPTIKEGEDGGEMDLSPEELKRQSDLAEGVKKIQLKRQHSFDPSTAAASRKSPKSPGSTARDIDASSSSTIPPPSSTNPVTTPQVLSATPRLSDLEGPNSMSSPFKKQRASFAGGEGLNITTSSPGNAGATGMHRASFAGGEGLNITGLPGGAPAEADQTRERAKAASVALAEQMAVQSSGPEHFGRETGEDEEL